MGNFLDSYRVCTFVPAESLERFIAFVGPRIPAFLGNYDHVCWWGEAGKEQYREQMKPEPERVPSYRFECCIPADDAVLADFIRETILPAHPWKEPVITITKQKIVKHAV